MTPLLLLASLAIGEAAPTPCVGGLDSDDSWMTAFFARSQKSLEEHRVGTLIAQAAEHRLQVLVGEVKRAGDQRCVRCWPVVLPG